MVANLQPDQEPAVDADPTLMAVPSDGSELFPVTPVDTLLDKSMGALAAASNRLLAAEDDPEVGRLRTAFAQVRYGAALVAAAVVAAPAILRETDPTDF